MPGRNDAVHGSGGKKFKRRRGRSMPRPFCLAAAPRIKSPKGYSLGTRPRRVGLAKTLQDATQRDLSAENYTSLHAQGALQRIRTEWRT